jgi:thiol:disulfide interchange protein DsbD
MKKLLLYFLLLCFVSGVSAQDSSVIKWNYTLEQNAQETLVTLHAVVPEGWVIYAPAIVDGLEGVRLIAPDSSIRFVNTKTPVYENLPDLIFEKNMDVLKNQASIQYKIETNGVQLPVIHSEILWEASDGEQFLPEAQKISIVLDAVAAEKTAASNRILIPTIQLEHPLQECPTSSSTDIPDSSGGLLQIFILGFAGGLVALLTPCVFPMIPLTVSYFTKHTKDRKKGIRSAVLYGFFIFLIYVLLSVPFHFLDKLNPEILNNISTNVYLNVAFFVIFIFFALSFFGFYEITLPASLSNKADSKSGAGNLLGIFFMALTLALVSFSCTGPILGSLLAGSLTSNGGAMQLTSGMAGFGLALALPFALFALFPNWLNSLPKSGGWLTTVKIVLGFLEFGLAFKFLSNADLVMHWGLLKREIFIGIWVLIGIALTLYLFNVIKFKHEYVTKPLSKWRMIIGVVFGLFTLYLIPGLTNTKYANLSLISGFPPPLYYSIYQQDNHCIYGLNCTDDYETGLQMARATGKTILLDFTGYACVNCRRMEENVWTKPEVLQLMKDSFVVVSLYVDDKKHLPVEKRFVYTTAEGAVRDVKTVGDKWALFETENFKNNAQPLYALLDTNEVLLNKPVGYTPDAKEYLNWLRCGLEATRRSNAH